MTEKQLTTLSCGVKERKVFAVGISEITGHPAIYAGPPTFAYTIGDFSVDKAGNLSFPVGTDTEQITQLLMALEKRGYKAAAPETNSLNADQVFSVTIPRDGFSGEAITNLNKIIASKSTLLKKALGAADLTVDITEENLSFQWFILSGIDGEAEAYTQFISALCNMAKTQKRVTAKEVALDNEKFTMRLFLIRLGFIGESYRAARRILLAKLSGNGSWRYGQPPTKVTNICEDTAVAP